MHFIGMSWQNIAAKGGGEAKFSHILKPNSWLTVFLFFVIVPVKIRKNMKENTSIDGTVDFGQHRVYTRPEDRMVGP
jgi:hypothetical protein